MISARNCVRVVLSWSHGTVKDHDIPRANRCLDCTRVIAFPLPVPLRLLFLLGEPEMRVWKKRDVDIARSLMYAQRHRHLRHPRRAFLGSM